MRLRLRMPPEGRLHFCWGPLRDSLSQEEGETCFCAKISFQAFGCSHNRLDWPEICNISKFQCLFSMAFCLVSITVLLSIRNAANTYILFWLQFNYLRVLKYDNSAYSLYIRPAQIFLVKCLKLHGGPWAKRWVHTNFHLIWGSFDHVSRAAKYCAFCCHWPKNPNFHSPRDVVKWRPN